MNAWIGLCQYDDRFPDTLAELGYNVDIIEPEYYINENYVQPDLVLTDPRHNNSLLLDFKSYTLKNHQNDRYQKSIDNPRHLVLRSVVTGVDPDKLEPDFAYSSFGDLAEIYDLSSFSLATIQFDSHTGDYNLRIEVTSDSVFADNRLNNAFPIEVSRKQDIPTDYYPFDAEEGDEEQFAIYMLNSAVRLANTNDGDPFSVDELLSDSHKLWGSMSEDKQQELRSWGERFLDTYTRKGLDEHLRKVQKEEQAAWFHKSKSLQALRRKTNDFIDDLKTELEQRELSDF